MAVGVRAGNPPGDAGKEGPAPGVLYLVGTPIGNLEDMSPRAVRVLREVDVIGAEDTRHTLKLLNHFGIKTPMLSYHQHNEAERTAELTARLRRGGSVALVTDAGMPGVSDPGERLVRAAVEAGVTVVPVPGPSAVLLALAASGLPTGSFLFLGFLPRQGAARRVALERLAREEGSIILYEAPHRLVQTLSLLAEVLGGERKVAVARELTKAHEEFRRGDLAEVLAFYRANPCKGEVTLILAGRGAQPEARPSLAEAAKEAEDLIAAGKSTAEAVRETAARRGVQKNALYRAVVEKKDPSRTGGGGSG